MAELQELDKEIIEIKVSVQAFCVLSLFPLIRFIYYLIQIVPILSKKNIVYL
jgi:predicted NACHT family NTPase